MHSSAQARSYYAQLIAGRGGTSEQRLVAAFEAVPRQCRGGALPIAQPVDGVRGVAQSLDDRMAEHGIVFHE